MENLGDNSKLSLFKHDYTNGAFDKEVDGPLHWAIQEEFIEAALYLIQEAGEDTNRLDSNQKSPLNWALGKKESIRLRNKYPTLLQSSFLCDSLVP